MARQMIVRSGEDLGAAVAEARRLRGQTQQELASATGVERGYLAKLEAGASVLLLERALKLLRRLGAEVLVQLPEADESVDLQQ